MKTRCSQVSAEGDKKEKREGCRAQDCLSKAFADDRDVPADAQEKGKAIQII